MRNQLTSKPHTSQRNFLNSSCSAQDLRNKIKLKKMASAVWWVLIYILGISVAGQQNAGPTLDDEVRGAVTRAVHWLQEQRRDDSSWGPFTPRALVALSLAPAPLAPADEMTVMKKQLNILLSLELNSNLSTKSMGLSRLALYVNALYATCQEPRNFHGLDLVRILRSRSDAALASGAPCKLPPVVFISLCLAQDVRYEDVRNIIEMYNSHRNKTDLQALFLLGLRCIAHQNSSSTPRHHLDSLLTNFRQHFNSIAPAADVYTLALATQVLQGDVKSLIEKQSPDGSFGSLLATYYAIPALLGTTMYNVRHGHCSKTSPLEPSLSYPLSDRSSPKVYYSVWVGEGDERGVHTATLPLAANRTFWDVMQAAQARNAHFRFHSEASPRGQRVYSIGGTPNDAQRELYWRLYKTKGEPNAFHPKRALHEMTMGVDQIHPVAEDHFIFWFRRHALRG